VAALVDDRADVAGIFQREPSRAANAAWLYIGNRPESLMRANCRPRVTGETQPLAPRRRGSIRAVHPFPPALVSPLALFKNTLSQAELFGRLARPSVEQFLRLPSRAFCLLHMFPVNSFGIFPRFPRQPCGGFSIRLGGCSDCGRRSDCGHQEQGGGNSRDGECEQRHGGYPGVGRLELAGPTNPSSVDPLPLRCRNALERHRPVEISKRSRNKNRSSIAGPSL
jgi:hypothetical protein